MRWVVLLFSLFLCTLTPLAAAEGGAPECDDALRIDHLIVADSDLGRAVEKMEELTGVRPVLGGEHPDRGTHNALLSLGPGIYLELLAPRPWAKTVKPADLPSLKRLTPIGWAVASRDLACTVRKLAAAGFETSEPTAGSRRKPDGTTLTWTRVGITRPQVVGLPFFIQWGDGSTHPSADAPAGCEFVSLGVVAPEVETQRRLVEALGLDLKLQTGTTERLETAYACPAGRLALGARTKVRSDL